MRNLTLPTRPLSAGRLALSLTGYTITGANGATFDGVNWPCGPYVVTDAAGAVIGTADLHWQAERLAVRTWRLRAEQADHGVSHDDVREQLLLHADILALEVQAAALECRRRAIDAAAGDDLWFLDHAMEAYGKAVAAHSAALHEVDQHDEQLAVAA